MEMMPQYSVPNVKTLISDTLRMFVGHGRRLTWADLATATGDKERKLRSYVETDGPEMPLDVFMRVFNVLPPEAFGRVCRHMGFAQPAPLDADEDCTVRRALSKASRLVANGNEALEDGTIDHRERAQLRQNAEELVTVLQAFVNASI